MAETTTSTGSLQVILITPEKTVFSGRCRTLQYPGEDGLYGVHPGHAAMITTVAPGRLLLHAVDAAGGGGERVFALMAGFAEVKDDVVRFVVDAAEPKDGIDVGRAEAAAERARERLARRHSDKVDSVRAEYALHRAVVRMRIARGQ